MKKAWKWTAAVLILGIVLALSACTNEKNPKAEADELHAEQTKSIFDNPPEDGKDLNDPLIIPSESGNKKETTNEHGTRYKGMGNNIYSTIGTSGIHEGGVSSFFESVLNGEGISGVKVFVVDDSVVLARNKAETTSRKYDHMQKKVLSGTEGMTGKEEPQPQEKEHGDNTSHDNLNEAKEVMNEMFNDNAKILTVTNPEAVDLIEKIEKDIKSSDYNTAAEGISKLLNMAK